MTSFTGWRTAVAFPAFSSRFPPFGSGRHHGMTSVVLILAVVLIACGPKPAATPATTDATPASASTGAAEAQRLRQQAETQYLPRLAPALADLVRGQPWFGEMTAAKLGLVAAMLECEQAARARGETRSVREVLRYAAEQAWYADGLDDAEATGLAAVFQAYGRSLKKDYAPPIGTVLASTLRYQLFQVVTLPETGDKVVLVAGEDERLGRIALDIAAANLPEVERIVGKFPYPFLYLEVTDEVPEVYAGLSYDEFIALAPDYVNPETIIHEITHSTLYGLFPLWFEEGFAHFIENYLTGRLASEAALYREDLRWLGVSEKVDLRAPAGDSLDHELAERAQGFLLLKDLYDLEGIDVMSATIKALRTRTYNDAELLAAIVQQAPDHLRPQIRRLYCERISGATRDYCAPAG